MPIVFEYASQSKFIDQEYLSNPKMNIIPANATFNAMVDAWNASKRPVPSKLPTEIFKGIVGEDELSSQSTYEVGMKEFLPRYEGLFGNELPIQEENFSIFIQNY